jgi:hypothetical protein
MSRRHTVEVPDIVWAWAQRKSGQPVPASWIRDNCLLASMIADIEESQQQPSTSPPPTDDARWVGLDMTTNNVDRDFTKARNAFVMQIGGDDKAIKFFEDLRARGIRDLRAWLMAWWRKEKPQAI